MSYDNLIEETSIEEFLKRLFDIPYCNLYPDMIKMEILSEITYNEMQVILMNSLIYGLNYLYNKTIYEIIDLSDEEILRVKLYYNSIGYDIDYKINYDDCDRISHIDIKFVTYVKKY